MKSLTKFCLRCLISGIACISVAANADNLATIDSLLHVYDQEIEHASTYIKQRQLYIDSVKSSGDLNSAYTQMIVGRLYIPYQCDSALHYLSLAANASDAELSGMAKLSIVYLLASIGYYNESFELAATLSPGDGVLKSQYYATLRHLYRETSVYGKLEGLKHVRHQQAAIYSDSLSCILSELSLTPSYCGMYDWRENEWFELKKMQLIDARNKSDYERAFTISDEVFRYVAPNTHMYAIFAYERACIYSSMQDSIGYLAWLIRSSIADVRSGVCDNGSSWEVANIMFEDGQLKRAVRYIDYSEKNARFFNAKLRQLQISPLYNFINDINKMQLEKMSRRLQWSIIGLVLLLVSIVILLLFAMRQNIKLHTYNKRQKQLNNQLSQLNTNLLQLNRSLRESDHVKEQYICKYLEVYSEYIQRIGKMARKAGIQDPEGFMKREMQEFYTHFDNTFLTIYHNFVPEFNKLLKPSYQIYPKHGELLTTELRIFALIRLGIDSSAKIAKLLCYSPNTIYNYRASMRNASIGDRNTFEERVKKINF